MRKNVYWFSHSYPKNTWSWFTSCRLFLYIFSVEAFSKSFCSETNRWLIRSIAVLPESYQCALLCTVAPQILRLSSSWLLHFHHISLSTPKAGVDIWGLITPLSFSLPWLSNWGFIKHTVFWLNRNFSFQCGKFVQCILYCAQMH